MSDLKLNYLSYKEKIISTNKQTKKEMKVYQKIAYIGDYV